MMQQLLNAVRIQAQMADNARAQTRFGLVSSYDPANYSAKVLLQPDSLETGWLPVLSQWVGNGWGLFAPPSIGDMVEVSFINDDIEAGCINLRGFNDTDRPLTVQSGEFWLQHKNGAFFKLLNNGSATLNDGHGATITLNGDGTITSSASQWNHTGNVTVMGNVIASGDISDHTNKSMASMRNIYNNHTHGDIQGGNTLTPNSSM